MDPNIVDVLLGDFGLGGPEVGVGKRDAWDEWVANGLPGVLMAKGLLQGMERSVGAGLGSLLPW